MQYVVVFVKYYLIAVFGERERERGSAPVLSLTAKRNDDARVARYSVLDASHFLCRVGHSDLPQREMPCSVISLSTAALVFRNNFNYSGAP